jgi:hypothetical protein
MTLLASSRSWFYRGQDVAKKPAARPSPLLTLSSEEQQVVLVTLLNDGYTVPSYPSIAFSG